MSSRGLEGILSEARRREEAYDWASAAELYEEASDVYLGSGDLARASELNEKIGEFHRLAAMQAESANDFADSMKLAIEAYKKAADLYGKMNGMEAEALKCLALAAYANYWLAPSADTKKDLIEEFNKLKTRVFELYRKAGAEHELGKAFNDLLMCVCESDGDRCTLEWDYSQREKTIHEALALGEKTIVTFAELKNGVELARTYFVVGKLYETARYIAELEERKKEFGQKSWSYLQKAVTLSEKSGNVRLSCGASIWLGVSTYDWAGNIEDSLKCFQDAMRQAEKTRDNYLKGHANHCLAYAYYWKSKLEQEQDKRRELLRKAVQYENDALRDFRIFSFVPVSFWVLPDSYSSLAEEETNLKIRHAIFEKAADVGREILTYAEHSGYFPRPDWGVYHGLSKAIYYLATTETSQSKKKQLCEESLRHREQSVRITEETLPFDYWSRGVFRNYLALLNGELAKVEVDQAGKREFLERAAQNMEESITWCSKRLEISSKASLYVSVARYRENYARILEELYSLTGDGEQLRNAIKATEGAIQAYFNVGWQGRIASAHWRIATFHNRLGQYLEAARNFESASDNYRLAAEKMPALQRFYLNYASYMHAWEELEKARHYHDVEEYAKSQSHYQKAADLYKTLKPWCYLASNYSAWAELEDGEDLSRKEKSQEAIKAFQRAVELFVKSKESIEGAIPRIQDSIERAKAIELSTICDIRREYCVGRVLLEEGRILNRTGDTLQSAEKYGLASRTFQRILEALTTESEREEVFPIVYSCQAWEKMELAERKLSPELFLQSSDLFEKAKEHSSKEKTRLVAMGNSAFCRALEAGTRFEVTRDVALYSTAKRNMESSAACYLKAGFENESMWVNASEALLDAYMYLSAAETEIVHEKKVQQYQLAEKYLERSVYLYEKSGHLNKRDEVLKILIKAREKREFAISLSEALKAPSLASSTAVIPAPIPTHEEAVGLERFEHVNIQGHLNAPKEVTVGQTFELRFDMVNVAKEPGLLVRIENPVPLNFKVSETRPQFRFEDGSIDMKGKRLEPQKVESVRILTSALQSGIAHLSPRIVYVDEIGKFHVCQPEPATVAVYPPGGFQFETAKAQRVFEYLAKAFVEDYMKRRLPAEKSGWRTLMQIATNAKTSKQSVYGTAARRGTAISELESRGVIEVRIFVGERGRGGRIAKARVIYEKDIIKRYIDQNIMKTEEK